LRTEAAARRHPLYRQTLLEHLARRFDPDSFYGTGRRRAGRPAIMAHEAALAHGNSLGERGDGQITAKIIEDPGVKALEPRVAVWEGERRTKRRLPAGPLEKDDERAGNRHGCRTPKIGLDECESQIYSSGNAGRGPNVAVLYEDRIGLNMYSRKPA